MTAAERVARGAALLDEQRPGWWSRITNRLDITCPCRCILGQSFEEEGTNFGYDNGLEALGPAEGDASAVDLWAFEHGFLVDYGRPSDWQADVRDVEAEWIRVIEQRRSGR